MAERSSLSRARRFLSVAAGISGLALAPIVLVRAYYEAPEPVVLEAGAPPAAEIVTGEASDPENVWEPTGPPPEPPDAPPHRVSRTIIRSQPNGAAPQRVGFRWPVRDAASITSPFGPRGEGFHHGVDIGCFVGEQIRASLAGRVIFASEARVYGNVVAIDHGSGYMTVYAHLSGFAVRVGDSVARQQTVGFCGSTGRSTGPHLHFELRYGTRVFDPVPYLS